MTYLIALPRVAPLRRVPAPRDIPFYCTAPATAPRAPGGQHRRAHGWD